MRETMASKQDREYANKNRSFHPPVHPSIHPSVHLSIRPSVRPSVCSFVRSWDAEWTSILQTLEGVSAPKSLVVPPLAASAWPPRAGSRTSTYRLQAPASIFKPIPG
ncbi:unnamed protein product [Protopolystoma xenopodis]|uniref:Uncharacterized protein n=1 Tax=Protopolystoma xenopodis TaxID=117903 RepID=A0A448WQT6_9PLAT|nr:unnamed protein product [Protopolystoma xenopodis]